MANIPVLARKGSEKTNNIPCLGFGTAISSFTGSEATKEAVLEAIKLGFRHFDTAAIYQTEKFVGEAIAEALSLGLVESRDDFFITSKLWISDAHHDRVLPALQNTLKELGLEYLDLYLIHWPIALNGFCKFPFDKKDLVSMDFKSVWEAMEECHKLGLAKSIGVSNFSCKKLETLLATAKIPPVVNQVEMNPIWQQKKLREFCEEKGILITAYSPLGAMGTFWGSNRVMENEILKEIARTKKKTVAQICLRWVYEQGVIIVVKSYNEKRMKENIDIFDWNLTAEELHKIEEIPQQKIYDANHFVHQEGPIKSVEEFWDGDI